MLPVLKGKGGKLGGGSVRLPHEDINTLQSRAYARFVDLIGEGPMEGFCTLSGITCRDAFLYYQPQIATTDGRLQWDDDGSIFPASPRDATMYHKVVAPSRVLPIVSDSAGYPFFLPGVVGTPIYALVQGDGVGAEILVNVYPTNASEQGLTLASIAQTLHGFTVGQSVVFNGTKFVKATALSRGEVRVVTNVIDVNNFVAGLDIFPDGKVRGLQIVDAGRHFTWAKVLIPPSITQAIFFDDVPISDPYSLKPNFTAITLDYRLGLEDQTPMPGFDQVEEVLPPTASDNIEVKYTPDNSTANIRTVTGLFDSLIIDIDFYNGFFIQNTANGDIEAIGSAIDTNLSDFHAFTRTHIDYTVLILIEQQFKKTSDVVYSAWSPFGRGTYQIGGKTMSPYVKSIQANLAKGNDPSTTYDWQIRITRLTPNDSDPIRAGLSEERRPNTPFKIDRVTGVSSTKLTYPFSALVGIQIDAQQFSRVPVRSYRMKLLKVQVPTNYFPPYSVREVILPDGTAQRSIRQFAEYNRDVKTGLPIFNVDGSSIDQTWDGTFYESWTNNPAWIGYFCCTDSRAGLGKFLQSADKWIHYSIARYCDEQVSSGYSNGTYATPEPRFTAGIYVQAKNDAFKFLSDLASIFSGFYYYAGGTLNPVQERPRPTRMVFTVTDVENGVFEYKGTQLRVRHTVAYIEFNDPSYYFKRVPVNYEDSDGIIRYGIQVLEKTAFGCISRGQARRMAKKLIRMENSNTDTVSFATGVKASVLRPGDIISIYDPVRSTLPYGGRVLGINTADSNGKQAVILDRWFDIDPALTASQFRIVFSKPSKVLESAQAQSEVDIDRLMAAQITEPLQIFAFDESAGRRVVIMNGALPLEVTTGAVWGLQSAIVYPQLFSVIGIEEVSKHKFNVSAIEYHEELFAEVDSDVPYSELPIIPDLSAWKIPQAVINLTLLVTSKKLQDIQLYTLSVSWSKPLTGFASQYEVWLQKGLGNYQLETTTANTHVDLDLPQGPDNYCVKIITIGLQGKRSGPTSLCTVVGSIDATNAEIISGLEITGKGNSTTFETADIPLSWRVNWSGADSTLHAGTSPVLPPGVTEYHIRFYDDLNNLLGEFVSPIASYTLSLDTNKKFVGGPFRDLIIDVRAKTDDGGMSAPTTIRVHNDNIAAPSFPQTGGSEYILATDSEGNATIRLKDPSTRPPDWAGIRVWISLTSGFTPTDTIMTEYGSSSITIALTMGQTNYLKWCQFDSLSVNSADCNISGEYALTPFKQARLSVFDFMHMQ